MPPVIADRHIKEVRGGPAQFREIAGGPRPSEPAGSYDALTVAGDAQRYVAVCGPATSGPVRRGREGADFGGQPAVRRFESSPLAEGDDIA